MPFQISPDPRFLWLGEKHKEALAVLKYGVLNNQGFLLLTGDVGTLKVIRPLRKKGLLPVFGSQLLAGGS
jgi:type II secretory pathway predicted ATPase ExeA